MTLTSPPNPQPLQYPQQRKQHLIDDFLKIIFKSLKKSPKAVQFKKKIILIDDSFKRETRTFSVLAFINCLSITSFLTQRMSLKKSL